MDLEFLGGAGQVGRSALLVNDRLLVDFGMENATPTRYPIRTPEPDAAVVSHAHLDHAGAVPALLSGDRRPPIHWTPQTAELARLLARDTLRLQGNSPSLPFHEQERKRLTEVSRTHGYREPFEAAGHRVEFFDAGHVPGSAHVLVDDGDVRLLYTGDFNTENQRLVAGSTARPDADVVVTESTYGDHTRPPRADLEAAFVESVRETLWEGGTVVAPAFAIGRTQEVTSILAAADVDCYVDGMGTRVTRLLQRHPEFLRDAAVLDRAKANARFVPDGAVGPGGTTGVRQGQRERIAEESTVVVTTAGMLSGGPAMTYVPAIRDHPTNKITLTGYQVEGTPGRELLETGRAEFDGRVLPVSAQVEYYDFSAHADREGLLSFLDAYRDAEILVVHGDDTGGFATDLRELGFDAAAPELGETVSVETGSRRPRGGDGKRRDDGQ
ncbi:MAG: MBL fold metallo-hydrolase [Halobacteriales archaeon]